ncbi:hypothetical protein [Streptomyces sp. NBC_01314]|uniref:hypothetical protein n=1 Tax=Streptomyces sp. NBC_01314 TaxID=2903821 RepID=UPI00308ED1D6|nr:hypothetical protein OG622_42435 [Streptomyces sp. NBC_01314]
MRDAAPRPRRLVDTAPEVSETPAYEIHHATSLMSGFIVLAARVTHRRDVDVP